jgi:hypothetical protein
MAVGESFFYGCWGSISTLKLRLNDCEILPKSYLTSDLDNFAQSFSQHFLLKLSI